MPDLTQKTPQETDPGLLSSPGPIPLHEHPEPTDGFEAVPLWLVTVFGILVFWGGWYLSNYSGGWQADVLDEDPAARMTLATTAPATEDPVALGKRLYLGNCAVCHQSTGLGVPGQYPPLAASEWVAGTPARTKRIVLHGFEGAVKVKGVSYNNAMPAFGLKLSDKQIAAVLTFVRGNSEWANTAAPVAPESVTATRAATKARPAPWTESELLAITTDEDPATAPTTAASMPAADRK